VKIIASANIINENEDDAIKKHQSKKKKKKTNNTVSRQPTSPQPRGSQGRRASRLRACD